MNANAAGESFLMLLKFYSWSFLRSPPPGWSCCSQAAYQRWSPIFLARSYSRPCWPSRRWTPPLRSSHRGHYRRLSGHQLHLAGCLGPFLALWLDFLDSTRWTALSDLDLLSSSSRWSRPLTDSSWLLARGFRAHECGRNHLCSCQRDRRSPWFHLVKCQVEWPLSFSLLLISNYNKSNEINNV